MQTVSELYARMWRNSAVSLEHCAVIAGVEYGEEDIVGAPVVSRSLFGGAKPTVGACAAGQLDISVIPKGEIPRMAEIRLYTRLVGKKFEVSYYLFNRIPSASEYKVQTPDGQTFFFVWECREGVNPSDFSNYVNLQWSYEFGLTGEQGGNYKTDEAGNSRSWSEPIFFSPTPPGYAVQEFTELAPWDVVTQQSEWIPKGLFYIDTRKLDTESGVLTMNCFDAMMKGDEAFMQEGDVGEWPRTSPVLAAQIAAQMGVELDERSELDETILVPVPAYEDMTGRELLSMIGTAHCGNWTMTDAGKLRLVPLWSIPEATHYLVDQYGDPITLGGVKILVD